MGFLHIGFNWLDLIIIVVFVFYAIEGRGAGFFAAFFDLISFVLSFALGLQFYGFLGKFLIDTFSLSFGFANAIGFFTTATMSELIFSKLFAQVSQYVLNRKYQPNIFFKRINHLLGIMPGIASAFILLSFLATLIVSLPLSPFVHQAISASKIGTFLLAKTQGFEKNLHSIFGGTMHETINFLTIEPQSNQLINLKFTTTEFSIDEKAEQEMLQMVNEERVLQGRSILRKDDALTILARKHSEDMLKRGYFSHYTPEGFSLFDRISENNIFYNTAGENLALAPNTDLAMQGLMNNPGHRANILSPDFHKIGIGVIDGGIYGEIFSQVFTD